MEIVSNYDCDNNLSTTSVRCIPNNIVILVSLMKL